ncbi:MAG: response regulator [Deltaproteobacteria bacterium]|nr:MAG: response regulator [Deltaproteobacteria bacterium]
MIDGPHILFVDDEAAHATMLTGMLETVLDARVEVVTSVREAIERIQEDAVDLVITDVFLPLGDAPREVFGPRARRYASTLEHLGGLVLLDELDRMSSPPRVLAHTACTEHAVFEALGPRIAGRVHKPASAEQMLCCVLEALGLPVPG